MNGVHNERMYYIKDFLFAMGNGVRAEITFAIAMVFQFTFVILLCYGVYQII